MARRSLGGAAGWTEARTWAWLGWLAVAPAAGCGVEGAVSLHFDVPDEPGLRPTGAETLTLVAQVGDDAPRATTAEIDDDGQVDLGELPLGDELWLSAQMRNPQAQLVGYGEAGGPIEIAAGVDTEATIPVRRPFVYLAGAGARLISFDASIGRDFEGQVAAGATPARLADVGGTAVAHISASGAVAYVSTATHQAASLPAVQLTGGALDAIASPDGAFLLVAQGGGSPQVAVIEVATGAVELAPAPGAVERVAVTRGADGGWWGVGLVGRAASDTSCGGSQLLTFPLADPETATVIAAGAPVSDLAGDARSGVVVLADRCGDRLLRFRPESGAVDGTPILAGIASPTAVAALGGRVWAVGHDRLETASPDVPDGVIDAWLVLGSTRLDGADAVVTPLEPVVERVLAENADYPDQDLVMDLHANWVEAQDLVILPGGEQLALLLSTVLHGDALGDDGFGGVLIPETDVTTEEYWVFDPSSAVITQRVRTTCDVEEGPCGTFCLVPEWACLPDIAAPAAGAFSPTGIAALFGAR